MKNVNKTKAFVVHYQDDQDKLLTGVPETQETDNVDIRVGQKYMHKCGGPWTTLTLKHQTHTAFHSAKGSHGSQQTSVKTAY